MGAGADKPDQNAEIKGFSGICAHKTEGAGKILLCFWSLFSRITTPFEVFSLILHSKTSCLHNAEMAKGSSAVATRLVQMKPADRHQVATLLPLPKRLVRPWPRATTSASASCAKVPRL